MKKFFSVLLTLSMVCSLCTMPVFAASDAVQADADALTVDDILSVPSWNGNMLIDNLDLDTVTAGEINQSPITWSTSNDAVVSSAGTVTRGEEDTEVTVTATVGEGDDSVTKEFEFTVPAASKNISGMPAKGTELYADTFSDAEMDSKLGTMALDSATDVYAESDGKFSITRSAWSYSGKEPGLEISQEVNANSVIEFTLKATSAYVRIAYIGYNWSGYPLFIHWYPIDNQISIGTSGTQDKTQRINLPDSAKGKAAKFTAYFDNSAKTYDLWVNNELLLMNQPYMQSSAQKVYKVRIFTVTSSWMDGTGTILVDNLSIYNATESSLLADMKMIESYMTEGMTYTDDGGNVYLIDNICLNTNSNNENTISYISDKPDVLSNDGTVIRSLVDVAVTVTASVTDANGQSMSKSFDYIIPGMYNKIGLVDLPLTAADNTRTANVEWSGTEYLNPYSQTGRGYTFTQTEEKNGAEGGILVKYGSALSGTFALNMVFETTSNYFRARIGDSNAKAQLVLYCVNGKMYVQHAGGIGCCAEDISGVNSVTAVFDFDSGTQKQQVSLYHNGTKVLDNVNTYTSGSYNVKEIRMVNICGSTSASGTSTYYSGIGTTAIYDFGIYCINDTELSSIMKGSENVSADKKTLTVPVFATDADGAAQGGTLIYAMYDTTAGNQELIAVKTIDLELDEYSHRQYSISLDVDSVPGNCETKAFYFKAADNIIPLTICTLPTE